MHIMARIDYHRLLENAPIFYVASLVTLVIVLVMGRQVFGSRRWVPLPGGFTFQVSEFVKLVVILLTARYLSELRGARPKWGDLVKLGALVALPMALVMKQPDLGTALTYLAIVGAGIFFSGLRWQHALAIGLMLVLIMPVGWMFLKDYQKDRLMSFRDPARDPLGSGYQVIQSKIAVGSGGMWGKGVTHGSQTQLRFLPVPHTDFILSAFAEEHGFVGVAVVLVLYFLMLMQILQNAQAAPDRAGMYVCMSICALLLFHVLVNVGMLVGRMPVTGVPLPLMSYGGSSVLTVFMMLGLVNNVRLQRFVN
jgi:rod shape determining protein RodA